MQHVHLAVLALAIPTFSLACKTASSTATTSPTTMNAFGPPTRSTPEIAADAKRDVYWLADDAREGRGLGTKGLEDSGQYIADRFAKYGLKPLPSLGGYFEPFDFDTGKKVGPETRLSLSGKTLAKDDFTTFNASHEGMVQGPVVFVGYAIQSKEHDYDDFAGIDVKDKVVLVMRWEPLGDDGKSRWDKDGTWTAESAIARKADRASKAGAKAILFVNAPTHHDDAERVMDPRGAMRRPLSIAAFHISVDAANALLKSAGSSDLASLQKQIDESAKPASRPLEGASVDANVQLEKVTDGVRNVVAYLPGKGPHADEYVVIGAHYDHVGKGEYGSTAGRAGVGQIHNGADDNASGTTAMMQLAEEFALAGRQDRSIIFSAFTLEELGLIGSRKFTDKLPVPKESIVGMLNLDMVGRMRNEFLYVGGAGTADAFDPILKEADARSPIELKSMGKGGLGPSDHLNFSRVKIPVLFFFTGMHPDYHAPGDDAPKINYLGVAQVVDLSFDVVRAMCAMDRPAYVGKYDNVEPDTEVKAGEAPSTRPAMTTSRSRVQLGVVPSYTTDDSVKGVLLDDVTAGTSADKAGLQGGDLITRLNDRNVDNIYDLTGFLANANPGDKVHITFTRAGKTESVDATLKARGDTN